MSDAKHRAGQRVFLIKLGLIVLALIGTVAVRNVVVRADIGVDASQTRAKSMALLSLFLWIGAIVAGRLMAYL